MPDVMDLMEQGRRFEGHGVLDRALESYAQAAESSADPALVSEALTHQSRIYRCRSEWEPAIEAARQAQQLASAAGLNGLLAEAVIAEANVLICRGDFQRALALFRQVLATTDDPRVRGIALQNIGSILAQQGNLGAAERAFAESFGCFRRAGYRLGEATALNNQGRVALDRGDAALAEQVLDQALVVARAIGYTELVALATLNYAEALVVRGDLARAEENASTALGYFRTTGNRWREIECLRIIGAINERLGGVADAVRCYERALCLANELGASHDAGTLRDCLSRMRTGSRV
ncbi:MAG: tetratricopeptide repeat protein [Gemmatimonadota bacterium]|nr:tetratricopeptide repeat protein [Gemmatimonadota bacterium]